MSDTTFFRISGLTTVIHTPETKKIWLSWPDNKSDYGRMAILNYAKELDFQHEENGDNMDVVKEAFDYLLSKFPGAPKSYIIREAIINHSP